MGLNGVTLLRMRAAAKRFVPVPRPSELKSGPPRHRRFLSGSPARREAWLRAAREYVSRKTDGNYEVALTPTVANQVFYFFPLRRRDY